MQDTVDDHWPYQVALAGGSDAADRAAAFCQHHRLSLRVMGPSVTYEGRVWLVYCFGRYDDADYFREQLGGRWVHAYLWRQDAGNDQV
jgi:hypothetical protein